jgi:hypothetical protein
MLRPMPHEDVGAARDGADDQGDGGGGQGDGDDDLPHPIVGERSREV